MLFKRLDTRSSELARISVFMFTLIGCSHHPASLLSDNGIIAFEAQLTCEGTFEVSLQLYESS